MKNVLSNKILAWYDNHKRDLPWRSYQGFQDKIYKVLVSEFMLQQTQVKTVIPFFTNFIEVFPNFKKLSKAKLEKVYKLWQGLGYYSRAKNLLNTAKIVQSKYKGTLPDDFETLMSFPSGLRREKILRTRGSSQFAIIEPSFGTSRVTLSNCASIASTLA